MTWLAFVKAMSTLGVKLKKAWLWIKSHGDIVFVIGVAILIAVLTRKSGNIKEILDIKRKAYKDEVDAIEKAHAEEIQKREKAVEKYHSVISKIEEKYEDSQIKLDSKKKKRIKEIVEQNSEDPDAITKALSEALGVSVYVD